MGNKVVPWIGTLGIDETSLHKMVRVFSSAAICGMSFSFIIGEAVDYRAKDIHNWTHESRLIPQAYLPLEPLEAIVNNISTSQIGNAVLAVNVLPNAAPLATSSIPKLSISRAVALAKPSVPAPNPEISQQDTVVVARAAAPEVSIAPMPTASITNVVQAPRSPTLPSAAMGVSNKSSADLIMPEPSSKEMAEIVAQIVSTNQRLTKQEKKNAILRGAALVSSGSKAKDTSPPAPAPIPTPNLAKAEPPPATSPNEAVIMGEGGASVNPTSITNANDQWLLRGRITGNGEALTKGHFEIGLFAKVDQDGQPVGYPLVQQILRSGKKDFELVVPEGVARGYLYGEFIDNKSGKRSWIAPLVNPVQRGDRSMAELPFELKDTVIASASSLARGTDGAEDKVVLKGRVGTMFSSAGAPIAQEDVVVKLRGRKESTRTNNKGEFSLSVPKFKGSIQLEFLKAGYHPKVATITEGGTEQIQIDMVSREAIERLAIRMGLRQLSTKGVLWGRLLDENGKPLAEASVRLNGKADGPYYFGEDGKLVAERKQSSRDGRFVFFNLEPGIHLVESFARSESIAPFVLSSVEGGEFLYRDLQIQSGPLAGRLFNPLGKNGSLLPLIGARVRIEGESDFVTTDASGNFSFGQIKWMRGQKISLDVSMEKFNNHRYLLTPTKEGARLDLYAVPAIYLGRLAQSMDVDLDRGSGIVLGKVKDLRVRVDALAEHSQSNPAKDFYFDARGKLKGSHSSTDPRYGTYVIFNVPRGNVILHGQDGSGALRYGGNVVSNPTAVSVVVD